MPDAAVPALLRQAAVVAYPALEEGFGLPALEALACGAPLVTTEGTAMAELARRRRPAGAARRRGRALADALEAALDRAAGRQRRALGLAVAGERTWEASVAAPPSSAYALAAGGLAVGFGECAR